MNKIILNYIVEWKECKFYLPIVSCQLSKYSSIQIATDHTNFYHFKIIQNFVKSKHFKHKLNNFIRKDKIRHQSAQIC